MAGNWKYWKNEDITVTCKAEFFSYHGACSKCVFRRGERGDHWTTDKAWCAAPIKMEKGDEIRYERIEKSRITILL